MNRRKFLKLAGWSAAGIATIGFGYSVVEAGWLKVSPTTLSIPRLPSEFNGLRAVFIADVHHGPFTGIGYVRSIVEMANKQQPEIILLGGDYVHSSPRYIEPCIEALSELRAPLGVFAVLGNHDHWESASRTRAALAEASIRCIDNKGVWLRRGRSRMRLAGVGDLWQDRQDLDAALGDATASDACLLLSHNPDYAEKLDDERVGLVLSGHTHGGQVVLPVIGAPIVPSRYGQKYLSGLVQAPVTQVFVSRGVGAATPPIRFACRPEINLLTFTAGSQL